MRCPSVDALTILCKFPLSYDMKWKNNILYTAVMRSREHQFIDFSTPTWIPPPLLLPHDRCAYLNLLLLLGVCAHRLRPKRLQRYMLINSCLAYDCRPLPPRARRPCSHCSVPYLRNHTNFIFFCRRLPSYLSQKRYGYNPRFHVTFPFDTLFHQAQAIG